MWQENTQVPPQVLQEETLQVPQQVQETLQEQAILPDALPKTLQHPLSL